jgi:hypothetical protein
VQLLANAREIIQTNGSYKDGVEIEMKRDGTK